MSDELHLSNVDLFAPRADFRGTRPLIWSAGLTVTSDLDMCRALVQPALHLRLEFKPNTDQDAIHALQRDLAFLLEAAGLLGAYPDDEQYIVMGLPQPMHEMDAERVVNWLSAHPVVAEVRFPEVQSLAQVLANAAGRELSEEHPTASVLLFSLIRYAAPEWLMARRALRHARQTRDGAATPDQGEEAAL